MKRITVIFISLLAYCHAGWAQNLDEYLDIARSNNPEIKAYHQEYLSAMERIPQAGALPDPELGVGYFPEPMERFMGNQRADIQLMQMFPWFGMLKTRKDEEAKMALASYELYREAVNTVHFEVKRNWFELYRLEQEIQLTEQTLDLVKQFKRIALTRFGSAGTSSSSGESARPSATSMKEETTSASSGGMNGMNASSAGSGTSGAMRATGSGMSASQSMEGGQIGMRDVLQIEIEVKNLESKLATLKDSKLPLQARFNQLLNRDMYTQISLVDSLAEAEPAWDRETVLDSIRQYNPMLKMLEAEEGAMEAKKRMASLEGRPMFGVGLNYMVFSPRPEENMSMGGEDMIMPMVKITLPIYRKKNKSQWKEAELKQMAISQRKDNTLNELQVEWAISMRDFDDAKRRSALYKDQITLTEQTIKLMTTAYATGEISFDTILRTYQQLLDFRLQLVYSVVDQHLSLARLENLAATKL